MYTSGAIRHLASYTLMNASIAHVTIRPMFGSRLLEGSMDQLRIFVSHSSRDKTFADALVKALRDAGADVWYDEHNLGTGQLLEEIQRELRARSVFIVILSVSAFASPWVTRECTWAFQLYDRDPSRTMLPIVATPVRRADFDNMLFLESFKRIAAPGDLPYSRSETINRTLGLIGLHTHSLEESSAVMDVSTLISEARILMTQRSNEQAIPLLDRAIELAPTSVEAWSERGSANWSLGRVQDALMDWVCWVILAPSSPEAWGNMGMPLVSLGRPDEALRAYDRAITLNASTWGWTRRGEALNALGRYDEALAAFEEALSPPMMAKLAGSEHNWVRADAWRGKAATFRALGREAAAQEADRRIKELAG